MRHFPGRNVAERIWARIGRVTGTIIRTDGSELLVDEGPTGRGCQLRTPASAPQAAVLGVLVVEVSVLVTLSPEFAEVMVRLGYNEPCEVRRLPVARSLTALRASPQWRQYHRYLITKEPADVWRLFDSSAASRMLPAIPRQRQGELLPAPVPEDSVVL